MHRNRQNSTECDSKVVEGPDTNRTSHNYPTKFDARYGRGEF